MIVIIVSIGWFFGYREYKKDKGEPIIVIEKTHNEAKDEGNIHYCENYELVVKRKDFYDTYYVDKNTYDKINIGDSIKFNKETMSKREPCYSK